MSAFALCSRLLLLFLSILLTHPAFAAAPGKRIALVIGNSAYKNAPLLANPVNDAEDMARTLSGLGFNVTKGLDLNKTDMDRLLSNFASELKGNEVGLFFYAGHGMQVSGQNYLVPVDARLNSASALEFETVRLDTVQRIMEEETSTNVIFLDACRDNPLSRNLARAMGTRSGAIGKGLAAQESGAGTIISYSTQPGNVALDGGGNRNSPFAGALVKHLPSEGKDLSSILVKVRNDVMAATAKRQVPWEHSALTDALILAGKSIEAQPRTSGQSAATAGERKVEDNPAAAKAASEKTTVEAAARSETVTPPPATGLIFSDTFDGSDLAKHWEIRNEDKNAYLVENGSLLLLTSKKGGLVSAPNALRLNGVDVEGDWNMSVAFRPKFLGGKDRVQLGLVQEDGGVVWGSVWLDSSNNCKQLSLQLNGGGSQEAVYMTTIWQAGGLCSGTAMTGEEFWKLVRAMEKVGGTLTLSKRGRAYQAKFDSPLHTQPVFTHTLTMLRAGGRPAFAVGKYADDTGQTSALVDEFRIERPK